MATDIGSQLRRRVNERAGERGSDVSTAISPMDLL